MQKKAVPFREEFIWCSSFSQTPHPFSVLFLPLEPCIWLSSPVGSTRGKQGFALDVLNGEGADRRNLKFFHKACICLTQAMPSVKGENWAENVPPFKTQGTLCIISSLFSYPHFLVSIPTWYTHIAVLWDGFLAPTWFDVCYCKQHWKRDFPYSHTLTCTDIFSPSLSHLHTHIHIQNCVRHLVLLLPLFPATVQNTLSLDSAFTPYLFMCLSFPHSEPELLDGWVLFYSSSFSQHLAGPDKDIIDVYWVKRWVKAQ